MVCICMHAHVFGMCVCACVRVRVCVCVYIYTCIYVNTHTSISYIPISQRGKKIALKHTTQEDCASSVMSSNLIYSELR